MAWLALGVGLLALAILAGRVFVDADPARLASVLAWFVGILGLLLVALLVAGGRLGWIVAALPFLIPLLLRGRAVWNRGKAYRRMADAARGGSGGAPGGTSDLRTRTLHMTLDHASGELGGRVLRGAWAGRDLNDLDLEAAAGLHDRCRTDDPESARVLEPWLDQRFGDAWRVMGAGRDAPNGDRGGAMSVEEAARVLGVAPDADAETVRAAHHRLIAAVHPDRGGSDFLAAKINQAKDVLLKGR